MPQWTVEFFPETDEDQAVPGYLENLPPKELAQVLQVINMLQELGPGIQQTKMDKLIEGAYRELRKNRHRIIYRRIGNQFILLVAFLKDSDRTPIKYIEMAKKRYEEYLNQ